jgi:hypothetical protein
MEVHSIDVDRLKMHYQKNSQIQIKIPTEKISLVYYGNIYQWNITLLFPSILTGKNLPSMNIVQVKIKE